jgi:hypothetical protein
VIYILDSNALMEPNRTYYAFDLAPSFWEWLSSSSLEGRVASIDRVKDEVSAGKGDLVEWVNGLRESFWLPETAESVASATEIARWANNPDRIYRREAIDEFMGLQTSRSSHMQRQWPALLSPARRPIRTRGSG